MKTWYAKIFWIWDNMGMLPLELYYIILCYIILYYILFYYILLYSIVLKYIDMAVPTVFPLFSGNAFSVSTFVGQAPAYGLSEVLELLSQRVVTAFSSPFRRGKSDSFRHSARFGAAMDIASSNQTWQILLYINSICIIIEGSLEVKLPTIWTDEKQSRAEAERRERLEERRSEEKESEERRCRCAKR